MMGRGVLDKMEIAAMLSAMTGVTIATDGITESFYSYGAAQESIAVERGQQQREIDAWNAAVDAKKAERKAGRGR